MGRGNFNRRGQGNQQRQRGGRNGERPSADQIFGMLDKDEDDKISKEEARGPLQQHFSRIDTDQDGFITKEEFQASAPKKDADMPPR